MQQMSLARRWVKTKEKVGKVESRARNYGI